MRLNFTKLEKWIKEVNLSNEAQIPDSRQSHSKLLIAISWYIGSKETEA